MKKEITYISTTLKATLDGDPWYGRPTYAVLDEIDETLAFKKPEGNGHSLADLLYHMIVWIEFTLERLEKGEYDKKYYETNDWREIDPKVHTWKKGVKQFKDINKKILAILEQQDDELLKQKVDSRDYNFRYLLHGIIQHNIYHLGQITYVKKLLEKSF